MGDDKTKSDSAKTPFLPRSSDDRDNEDTEESLSGDYEASEARPRKRSWLKRHRNTVIIHSLLMISNMVMMVMLWRKTWAQSGDSRSPVLYTPVHDFVVPTAQTIRDAPSDIKASPFVGAPSPEIDAAWDHLLRHHNLRIAEDEMKAMNISSIAFARGGGYHGMMAVFHELHCLRLVREATRQEYYYRGISDSEKAYLVGHTDHCIEVLRTGSMCRADTAIFPYHWSDVNRVPNPTWRQRHECADWQKLEEWLEPRRVDIHGPNVLVHPKYGPTYPGGKKIEEPDGPKVYPLDPE